MKPFSGFLLLAVQDNAVLMVGGWTAARALCWYHIRWLWEHPGWAPPRRLTQHLDKRKCGISVFLET